ncbi:MAG: helix-turn-helix domain-containing protein, partial [Candidatus Omnitrophica bacterium]|nr:helix-turn-helix domain-containing protein [Candidatus Omnitrophota bacterium]
DFTTALNSLGERAKTQRQILDKLYQRFEKELKSGWEVNFEEIAEILDIKKETLARAIKTLAENNIAEYRPPFRGTEINILKRVSADEVDIDFSALKNKLKKSCQKLDMLEDYVYHFGCRQKHILDYFGDSEAKNCGICDNCLTGNGYARKTDAPRERQDYSKQKNKKRNIHFHGGKDHELKVEAPDINIDFTTKLTQLQTFDLYNQGMTIDEMAQTRNVKPGTIVQHLCYLMEKKLAVDINKFVSQAKQKKITEAINKVGDEKLTQIKEELDDDVSWDEIRMVVSISKQGL